MQGTKVTLAGRTAFLPNADVPFVLQRLTMGQIDAIPKDRFSVSLVELPTPLAMAGLGRKGRGGVTVRGLQRMKGRPRLGERGGIAERCIFSILTYFQLLFLVFFKPPKA